MRHLLLTSVAALALAAASTTVTLAQKQGGGAPGASGMSAPAGTNAPAANPSGPASTGTPGAAQSEPSEKPAPNATAPNATGPGGNRGAQDRTIPEKQKSTQQTPSKGEQPTQKQGQATTHEERGSKQGANERDRNGQRGTTQQSETTKQGGGTGTSTSERSMTSKNVSLTTEQKTTIRTKVLTNAAPRVTNVNFDIHVGTVVPRTVRVAPVPTTIVEIEPAWRGFMYFVHADEIIIVDPHSLEIVAVLDV
jgi:hypothetical protein